MKRHAIRILILLWIGWYLSGPVAETFDFWDPPREEMHDLMRNAGGLMSLAALVAYFGIAAFQKLRQRWKDTTRAVTPRFITLTYYRPGYIFSTAPALSHSPRLTLRI